MSHETANDSNGNQIEDTRASAPSAGVNRAQIEDYVGTNGKPSIRLVPEGVITFLQHHVDELRLEGTEGQETVTLVCGTCSLQFLTAAAAA